MSRSLLIADDEEVVREGLVRYIKLHCDLFDEIYEAKDGSEALDLAFKHAPQLILLDVQMPVYTGIDVMRQISQSSIKPIVLIISGYDEFKYAQQAMHYGAKEYLIKPVKAQELVRRIYELMGEKKTEENDDKAEVSSIVKSCMNYIEDHYSEDLSLSLVSEKMGLSSSYLSTKFSQEMGMVFIDYVNKIRVEHACDFLKHGYLKIYEITEKVGFNDTKYFSKIFKKVTGVSPKEYMQNNKENQILK